MNKYLGHLLVLAAFVGLGNGLAGGAGGAGAGSAGGHSSGGAGGSNSDPSLSGLVGSGDRTAPKNATLVLGSSGGGGAGGSAGGSEGLSGHPLSGGPGLASGVDTTGGSNRNPGSSDSTRSLPSATSGPSLDLTGGFGAGHSDVAVPGGAPSQFGGFGSGSMFDNFPSGFGTTSGGAARGAGGSAATGAGPLGRDQFSGRDLGLESDFGQSGGLNGSPGSSFITRGSSFTGGSGFEEGRPGDLGAWSSRGNSYGGDGAPVGRTHGFGGFNEGSEFGNFDAGASAFGLPEGTGGGFGADGIGSRGGPGAFPTSFDEREPGDIFGPESGHGVSFPSSSGYAGSPTGESPTDFGRSNPDSSNGPGSSLAHVPEETGRQGLFPRLWPGGRRGRGPFGLGHRRRKTDPRLAAAIALGTLAGVSALGSIGAGIAAAIHNSRTNGIAGSGRARRGCVSGNCHRKRRSISTSKVAAEILNGIPTHFERL